MTKIQLSIALVAISALFAGYASADRITFYEKKGGDLEVQHAEGVTITAWSASTINYETSDGKASTLTYDNVISLDRNYGSMSQALTNALKQMGAEPARAQAALQNIASNGNALDKEEAKYVLGEILYNDAAGNKSRIPTAISAFKDYIGSYPKGYFARDAYTRLAELQKRAGKVSDARSTLGSMARADNSMKVMGNQKLGEFEAGEGEWKAAISAFKDAKSGAGADKNAKHLAQAWEGLCTLKDGDGPAAKTLLETITEDEKFDDPNSTMDEIALGVAHRALGDVHAESEAWESGYDAYVKGAYYSWWIQGNFEGYCLAQAYYCAKKLEGTDDKWKKRKTKLRTALAVGFPRELQRIESE